MISVLRSVTPWLLAVMLGVAVYAGMQARHFAISLADTQARAERAEDRALILLEHQYWQKRQIEVMADALEDREQRQRRDAEIMHLLRQTARDLEHADAETAEWADRPIPVAVDSWLRELTSGTDNAEPVPSDTSEPDE